jgi:hypothetical protein
MVYRDNEAKGTVGVTRRRDQRSRKLRIDLDLSRTVMGGASGTRIDSATRAILLWRRVWVFGYAAVDSRAEVGWPRSIKDVSSCALRSCIERWHELIKRFGRLGFGETWFGGLSSLRLRGSTIVKKG